MHLSSFRLSKLTYKLFIGGEILITGNKVYAGLFLVCSTILSVSPNSPSKTKQCTTFRMVSTTFQDGFISSTQKKFYSRLYQNKHDEWHTFCIGLRFNSLLSVFSNHLLAINCTKQPVLYHLHSDEI